MANSPKAKLTSAARATAAPVRNYFNNHFEMTKQEVRRAVADSGVALEQAQSGRHLAELSNVVAETQLYQSKMISELRREVAALREDLAQMSATSAELAAVLAAMTLTPDTH